jgi:hypothetical protein
MTMQKMDSTIVKTLEERYATPKDMLHQVRIKLGALTTLLVEAGDGQLCDEYRDGVTFLLFGLEEELKDAITWLDHEEKEQQQNSQLASEKIPA